MNGLRPVTAATLVHVHWVALKHQSTDGSPSGTQTRTRRSSHYSDTSDPFF